MGWKTKKQGKKVEPFYPFYLLRTSSKQINKNEFFWKFPGTFLEFSRNYFLKEISWDTVPEGAGGQDEGGRGLVARMGYRYRLLDCSSCSSCCSLCARHWWWCGTVRCCLASLLLQLLAAADIVPGTWYVPGTRYWYVPVHGTLLAVFQNRLLDCGLLLLCSRVLGLMKYMKSSVTAAMLLLLLLLPARTVTTTDTWRD